MEDFEPVFETGGEWPDYMKCVHCGARVERGIVSVSHHWLHCLKRRDGLVVARDGTQRTILDSWSANKLKIG